MTAILEISGLYKNYGTTEILKDINVSIDKGDFLVLVGPSGCGKSTLLNCIAGLEPITGGAVRIGGQDMTHVSPKDRNIAMVFQSYALYPTMTVARNITFGMQVRGVDKATQARKLAEVAKQLQIDHLLHRRPGQLSGGQRQRVAMGRALVRDPQLFCSTNRCRTSMPSCGWKCAPRSSGCIRIWAPAWSMSPMTRSRR
jgi:multiple sugar transport system ATP-binding protein